MSKKSYTQDEVDELHRVWNKLMGDSRRRLRKYFEEEKIPEVIAAHNKKWIERMEESWCATDYHSPEAGKGNVNSIAVEDWQQLKKDMEAEI